jgi:hypothetical protein
MNFNDGLLSHMNSHKKGEFLLDSLRPLSSHTGIEKFVLCAGHLYRRTGPGFSSFPLAGPTGLQTG